MGALEIFGKSIEVGGVDLELADIGGNVLIKLLADLYQLVLQPSYFLPGGVVAVNAGAMVVAQCGPQVIAAGRIEPGAIERCQHLVHVFIERDVGEHAADFLFASLGRIAERLRGMHLLGQAGAIFGVHDDHQGGVEGLQAWSWHRAAAGWP